MGSEEEDRSQSGDPVPAQKTTLRACDQCNQKRAKCNGQRPCNRCGRHGCTYDRPRQKKGPRPKARQVIASTSNQTLANTGVDHPQPVLQTDSSSLSVSDTSQSIATTFSLLDGLSDNAHDAIANGSQPGDILPNATLLGSFANPSGSSTSPGNASSLHDEPPHKNSPYDLSWIFDPHPTNSADELSLSANAAHGAFALGLGGGLDSLDRFGFPVDIFSWCDPSATLPAIGSGNVGGGSGGNPRDSLPSASDAHWDAASGGLPWLPPIVSPIEEQMNVKEAHPGPATGSGAIFLPTGFSRATSPVSDPFSQGSNLKFEDRVSPMVPIILHSILLPQIDVFYERLNDIIPIIPKAHLVSRINRGDHETSADFAALLLTMAALALTQPVATDEMRNLDSSTKQARGLLDEACRLKGSANLGESVSLETVLSSFLLSWCFLGLGRSDISWFRLKEAVTLAETMQMKSKSTGKGDADDIEQVARERLYELLSNTERIMHLHRRRLGLVATRKSDRVDTGARGKSPDYPPSGKPDAATSHERAAYGLQRLTRLFNLIDDGIVGCWSDRQHQAGACGLTPARILKLQRDIDDAVGVSELSILLLPEIRFADLVVTQQWLKCRIWRMSAAHSFVSKLGSQDPELSVLYPVRIGNATLAACETLDMKSAEANGLIWVEKLWDISQSIISLVHVDPKLLDQSVPSPPEGTNASAASAMGGASAMLAAQSTGWDTLRRLLDQMVKFRGGQHPYAQKLKNEMRRLASKRT